MLLFEILLTIFTFLNLFLLNRKNSKWKKFFLSLWTIILIIHFNYEELRWQLVPIYFVGIYCLLKWYAKKPSKRTALFVCGFTIIVAAVVANFLPVIKHNDNTGNYAVGTYSFEVRDTQRQRNLPTKVWFPIKQGNASEKDLWLQTYTHTGPEIASRAGMPGFIFQHLSNTKPTLISNPSKALFNEKPLLLLSHGRGAIKEFNAFMAQEFASHGYVVIASDHTKGSILSVLRDGSKISFDPKEFGENEGLSADAKQDRVQQLGLRWSKDLDIVLNEFHKLFPNYKNRKVIVGGHSTGGGATIQYCNTSPNCLGVIGLDPWFEPVSDSILSSGINKPLLSMFSDPYEKDFEPINHKRYEKIAAEMAKKNIFSKEVVIAKSGHIDFCDAALLSPYSYIFGQDKGKINTRTVMKIINQYALDFSNALSADTDLTSLNWKKFPEEMDWVNVE